MKNNLIALLDQTYPGANDFFDSPARSDGSQKWVDFVHTYWHVDCVRSRSPEASKSITRTGANAKVIISAHRKRKISTMPLLT